MPSEVGVTGHHDDIDENTIAYLQYTSDPPGSRPGCRSPMSTRPPTSCRVIEGAGGRGRPEVAPGLPFFHDMGLITALLSPMIGRYCTFCDTGRLRPRAGR